MSHGFDAGGSSFLDHGLLLQPEGLVNTAAPSAASAGPAAPPDLAAPASSSGPPSRYESQKRRDWNTFGQYLRNHRPPLAPAKCSGAHVLEFLRYLDQFGKTKVHTQGCPFFGHPQPPAPCGCPLRQAWGSLDALIGRLRAAYEEHGFKPETNPFGTRAVRLYLREVRETQAKARGIAYEKKKRKKPSQASSSTSPSPQTSFPTPPLPPPQNFPPPLHMDQFHPHHYLHPSLHQDGDFKQN
ncbi:hypothetical protein L7F22_015269 [Adiantum nelumboides]|nr:hypothetical protein [Adiantum nelumboides]